MCVVVKQICEYINVINFINDYTNDKSRMKATFLSLSIIATPFADFFLFQQTKQRNSQSEKMKVGKPSK
jgi:hypothetical protein